MNNPNDIDKSYQDAIDTLRQINDDLFYNDLKGNIHDYLEQFKKYCDEADKKFNDMERTISRLPNSLKAIAEESLNNITDEVERSSAEIHSIVDGKIASLRTEVIERMESLITTITKHHDMKVEHLQCELINRITETEASYANYIMYLQEAAATQSATLHNSFGDIFTRLDEERARYEQKHRRMNIILATLAIGQFVTIGIILFYKNSL